MQEIDVAVFAFDAFDRLRLVNRAGERLLAASADTLAGTKASELGMASCLRGESFGLMDASFPGRTGRWEIRRTRFWQSGSPHQLVVLSDLSRALREEERQAWKRLIRVIGHELNNSLAPIRSIAASLTALMHRNPRPPDWEEDMRRGLGDPESRRVPEPLHGRILTAGSTSCPRLREVDVAPWIERVACLETRLKVEIVPGPGVVIRADEDQLDQLLINLLRNAVDSALQTGGSVKVSWLPKGSFIEVVIEDEGTGISNAANLFVPFFTTKPQGSGIGLVLSRQIAEAHQGSLSLENRTDREGCRAILRLPVQHEARTRDYPHRVILREF